MNKFEYMANIFKAFNEGRISEEAYDAAMMNVEAFCYDDEEEEEED